MDTHIKQLITDHSPDVIFFLETKRHKVINLHDDLGDINSKYRSVQVRITDTMRSGMIAMIKMEL